MPGLLAARAATRMGARQQYRTMARMQRRRTSMESKMGMRQDFQPAGEEEEYVEAPPAQADYTAELERLAELRDKGVITAEEFDAKKHQLLGL
ncbi:MAG TPA: SHOCT domain-containing protein [Thermoleophilaceae bacterium]|nr:SHOCT domain-containing protein [Thermoleophilaceae bacterium]